MGCKWRFTERDWLLQWWKLRSPTVCCLQARDLGSWWCDSMPVWRPENQGSWWCKSQSKSKRWKHEIDASVHAVRKKNGWIPPSSTFFLFRPSANWRMPTPIGEGNLLYWVHWLRCSSHPETPSQTHRELTFNLGTRWPVKLTHKMTQHQEVKCIFQE